MRCHCSRSARRSSVGRTDVGGNMDHSSNSQLLPDPRTLAMRAHTATGNGGCAADARCERSGTVRCGLPCRDVSATCSDVSAQAYSARASSDRGRLALPADHPTRQHGDKGTHFLSIHGSPTERLGDDHGVPPCNREPRRCMRTASLALEGGGPSAAEASAPRGRFEALRARILAKEARASAAAASATTSE